MQSYTQLLFLLFIQSCQGTIFTVMMGFARKKYFSSRWRMLLSCGGSRRICYTVDDWCRDSLHLHHHHLRLHPWLGTLSLKTWSPRSSARAPGCHCQWWSLLQMCQDSGETVIQTNVLLASASNFTGKRGIFIHWYLPVKIETPIKSFILFCPMFLVQRVVTTHTLDSAVKWTQWWKLSLQHDNSKILSEITTCHW